jgi:hypothetical protein
MIQKVMLIGCKEGPWIRLRPDYRNPRLRVAMPIGTKLLAQIFGQVATEITEAGEVLLSAPATFVRVAVLEGDPELVVCHLLAERDAIQAA